ncbi:fused uroporphyrinogen-III synthase HemD/membrane protein HemX [Burkholderia sp. L27(2015)]|uniref:fused uroporphyrinogen-III synthase HemD/membrane protein HemX n=1 Tax=Burkholderia sp. L27(2015) TaxID=1641858 RepID=UPI00131BAE1C|nr:fused uroporphyrinogen-III synthase HemD/membrane protein HemX [Burkholderia sp. L27(2015)]
MTRVETTGGAHGSGESPASKPTVIVTRPAAQAAGLSAALGAAGFATFEFPLLEIAPVRDPQPLLQALVALEQYALVVFVSPNAIEHALAHLGTPWPAQVPIGVLGPGSVRALAQRGISAPRVSVIAPRGALASSGDGGAIAQPSSVVATDAIADTRADSSHDTNETVRYDSEALLDALDHTLHLDSLVGKRVLLVKGDGGRELLTQTLQAMGVAVDAVTAYHRSAPQPSEAQWQRLHVLLAGPAQQVVWVVTSSEGLRHLDALARAHLDATQLVSLRRAQVMTPHARIAETARSLGFDTVTVSGAGDRNIVSALLSQSVQLVSKRMTDTHDMQSDPQGTARPAASAAPAYTVAGDATQSERPFWDQPPGGPRGPSNFGHRAPLWIGLLLVLAAAVAGGLVLNRALHRDQQASTQRQDASDARIAAALAQTQQALAASRTLNDQLTQFNSKLQDQQAAQQALQQQYQDFTRNRDDWTLAEIGQMLSTASEQLQLTGNVQLALFALQSADERLAASSGPQMLTVRRAVQHDIEKLKATPQVDLAGLAIKLDDAIAQIDNLPLLGEAKTGHQQANPVGSVDTTAPAASTLPAWRVWIDELGSEVGRSLTGLVQVRRIDNPDAMLVAPDQGYYLRANLRLRLLSARLSLLARNPATLKSDLTAASASVNRYFDPASKQVQTVKTLLQQVDQAAVTVQVPDMNGSLAAVRQFKSRG